MISNYTFVNVVSIATGVDRAEGGRGTLVICDVIIGEMVGRM